MANAGEPDAYVHYEELIATIVSPKDCARCHEKEVREFVFFAPRQGGPDSGIARQCSGRSGGRKSRHENSKHFPKECRRLPPTVAGSATAPRSRFSRMGKLDAATWPNTGIGRLNPDGSEGSCAACHSRHSFSVAQARQPENCGKCHMGPDHPQIEIYNESKHGIAYHANNDKMNLDSPKWIPGEDYSAAPTCATCHMSATLTQPVTHDIGMRISWNNRPPVSIRPEVSDAKMNLPGKDVPWDTRRANMQDVCSNCHSQGWIDNWYIQYDGLIDLYNNKFAKPGLALYNATAPLRNPVKFSNTIDFTWFEIWHHEGRRARHGASMMGPDYTHWHGTYEVAKHFYTKFIPEIEELIEKGRASENAEKQQAAEKLASLLEEILHTDDHKWIIGKMSPEEKAAREKAAEEFKARYK